MGCVSSQQFADEANNMNVEEKNKGKSINVNTNNDNNNNNNNNNKKPKKTQPKLLKILRVPDPNKKKENKNL